MSKTISKINVSPCFPAGESIIPKPAVTLAAKKEVKKNTLTLRTMVNDSQHKNKFNWKTRTIKQPFCTKNPHLD